MLAVAAVGATLLTGCAPGGVERRYQTASAALELLPGVLTVDLSYETHFPNVSTTEDVVMREDASAEQVSAALEVLREHAIDDVHLAIGDHFDGSAFFVDGAMPEAMAIGAEVDFWYALRSRFAGGVVDLTEGENVSRTGDPFERRVRATAQNGSMVAREAADWIEGAMALPRPPGGTAWQVLVSGDDGVVHRSEEPALSIDIGVDPAPALALWRTLSDIQFPGNVDAGYRVSTDRREVYADGDCPRGEFETWDVQVDWTAVPDALESEPAKVAIIAALEAYQNDRRGPGEFSVYRFGQRGAYVSDRDCHSPVHAGEPQGIVDALASQFHPRPCECPALVPGPPATR